jgi:hypothetical protein
MKKAQLRFAQFVFWSALLFTCIEAILPPQNALQPLAWDKAVHFAAFYILLFLAAAAFPRRSVFLIAALLSGMGAAIEIVQALPIVNRDSDFKDWVADTLGILAALAPQLLGRWRDWQRQTTYPRDLATEEVQH